MAIDHKKLKNEFIVSGNGTVAELIGALDRIPALEQEFKARPKKIRWWALGVFIALAVIGIFGGLPFLLPFAFIVPIGMTIYSAVMGSKPILVPRADLLRLMLHRLGEDAGSKARFDVTLRLRAKEEKMKEEPNPRNKGGKQTFYRDEWLTIASRMADGTTLSESCADITRKRTKTNGRKIKTKARKVSLIRAQLRYNPKTYGNAALALKRLPKPFRVPGYAEVKAVHADEKRVAVKMLIRGDQTPLQLNTANDSMLLGAYRVLNLARRGVGSAK